MPTQPIDPPFSRILVGVDDSAEAEEAVRQAARLAALTGAGLEMVHVFDGVMEHPAALSEARRRVDEILAECARLAQKEEVDPERRLLIGDPAALLEHEARERWADLICVGAAPDSPPGRVARHTLQRTRASVLIAREPAAPLRFPRVVLCAVDGSAGSLEAVRQAAGLAAVAGAAMRLIHVVPERESEGGMVEGAHAMRRAAAVAQAWGVQPLRELTVGPPAPAVLELAEEAGADLLVVGSRGLHGLRRVLLGSVSEWVCRHARCSVLVARRRPR